MPWQTPAEREYVAGCVNAWQRREPLDTERVPHTRVAEPLDQVEEVERNDERRASLFVDE